LAHFFFKIGSLSAGWASRTDMAQKYCWSCASIVKNELA
jgi:hypothetical protein